MPAPVLTGLNDIAVDSSEVDDPHLLDANVVFSDADGDFNGARLTITGIGSGDDIRVRDVGAAAGQTAFDYWTGTIRYGGVVIGQMAGGSAIDMTITFNAQATAAGIEAVIENLTYQNYEGAPGSRTLVYTFFDAAGNASGNGFHNVAGAGNPYFSHDTPPYVLDVNGDGRLDLVFGDYDGPVRYFRNTGTNAAPVYAEQTGSANPFAAVPGIVRLIRDLDADGDLDLYVTASDGFLIAYRNTGSAAAPVYTTSWLSFVGQSTLPLFGDMDGDGDLDALVSNYSTIQYFENTGTSATPVFTERTGPANPLNGFGIGYGDATLGDVDNDGDLDLVVLPYNTYTVQYYRNVGTATHAVFEGSANPFGRTFSTSPSGRLQDADGDGDMDLLVDMVDGSTVFVRNDGPRRVITVTINDEPSVAQDDLIYATEGRYAQGYLFGDNGSGADTDTDTALTVIAVNGSAANVGVEIVLASGAKLRVYADGAMGYDPGSAFDGLPQGQLAYDSFTYTLVGGDTATVTVEIIGIAGTSGDDRLIGDAARNTLDGGAGDDFIDGTADDDELIGGAGDDYLRGGAGADSMSGGEGDDFYAVEDSGDTTFESAGEGTDLVWSRINWTLWNHIENLTLGAGGGATNGTGNLLANLITGNAYANVLSGLDGADTLLGDGGNDTLRGGNAADSLDGGSQNDILEGGAGADDLIGAGGNDRLDGGTGGDDMLGGLGNDIYVVDSLSDTVLELAAGGTDRVESSVSWALGADVEHLTLTGASAIDGGGNALRNTLIGNSRGNTLSGGGEIDTLDGGGGADILLGGAGSDRLTGGDGADIFRFTNADVRLTSLGQIAERDLILDRDFDTGDRIDLSQIDADVNTAGDQAFHAAPGGRVFGRHAGEYLARYMAATDLTTVEFDVDGDGKADFRIALPGSRDPFLDNLYTGPGDQDGGWIL